MELTYLSKRNTDCVKGILALVVVLHHLDQNIGILSFLPGLVTSNLGYWAVGMFFFLSGYGLMASYDVKGDRYIQLFLRKRVIPYYAMYATLVMVYAGINLIMAYEKVTIKLILQSLFFGRDTIVSKGWYLQVSMLAYIGFFLIFKHIKNGKNRGLASIASVCAWMIFCKLLNYPIYYYQTLPAIVFGAFWHKYRLSLDRMLDKWMAFVWLTAGIFVCMIILHCSKSTFVPRLAGVILVISWSVFLLKRVHIENKVTRFLGRISFELYVTHGYIPLVFEYMKENRGLYICIVLAVSLCLAILVSPVIQRFDIAFKRISTMSICKDHS